MRETLVGNHAYQNDVFKFCIQLSVREQCFIYGIQSNYPN